MINILFFIESLSGGGAEKVLCNLVNAMDKERFSITVQTLYPEAVKEKLAPGIKYKYCYPAKNRMTDLLMRTEAALGLTYPLHIKGGYDIEAAYLECGSTKIMAGSTNKKALKLTWVHCDLKKKAGNVDKFIKSTAVHYRKYDSVVCVSEDVKQSFIEMYGMAEKVGTVYNCYNDTEVVLKADMPAFDPIFSEEMTKKEPVVVAVGRLTAQKGFDRLLRAHKRLTDEGIHHRLRILGEGEERKSLETFIKQNELGDSAALCGFQNNPYPMLKCADLYVCSSLYEGFSTTVVESLILGTPVVTTDCTGMREILGDSEYGLITANDDEAFYEGVKRMLTEPGLLSHYAEQAKLRGKDFKCERLAGETEAFFEAELRKKRGE